MISFNDRPTGPHRCKSKKSNQLLIYLYNRFTRILSSDFVTVETKVRMLWHHAVIVCQFQICLQNIISPFLEVHESSHRFYVSVVHNNYRIKPIFRTQSLILVRSSLLKIIDSTSPIKLPNPEAVCNFNFLSSSRKLFRLKVCPQPY